MGFGNEEHPVVDDFAGGLLGIAGELIGFAGAVEEFVAEEAALGVENGLTAEEAVGGGDGRESARRRGARRFGGWRRSDRWHGRFAGSPQQKPTGLAIHAVYRH